MARKSSKYDFAALAAAERPRARDRIVVGIDFGTTFSGAAYIYAGSTEINLDDIRVIMSWLGGNSSTSEKLPTIISYSKGPNAVIGKRALSDNDRIQCIKLLLDKDQRLPSFVDRATLEEQLKKIGKTPVQVAADYLTEMMEQIQKALLNRYGAKLMATTKTEYVLTVPAMWSDAAKDATMTAAKTAGIGAGVQMISEPEAAAIYALSKLPPGQVKVGQVYIVCDGGGGTVDLITYEVNNVSPLRFSEVVPGTGGMCGATFLNIRFVGLLRSKMGSQAFEEMKRERPMSLRNAEDWFEDGPKKDFNPQDTSDEYDAEEFFVPVPGVEDDLARGIQGGFLTITSAEVASIFRPLIDETIGLIEDQRNKAATQGKKALTVILVGGFCMSQYLHDCIRRRFANPVENDFQIVPYARAGHKPTSKPTMIPKGGLQVIQSAHAWTAVVRGAVLSNAMNTELVSHRKARRHYGTVYDPIFDPEIHPVTSKYVDQYDGKTRASSQMKWFIKKGDNIVSNSPVLHSFCQYSWSQPSSSWSTLYYCEEDEAPTAYSSSPYGKVKKLCNVTANTKRVPKHKWHEGESLSGRGYLRLDFHLGVQLESGRLKFDFRIGGTVHGSVDAKFE
ncbi:putative hsp70 family protein [Elsinoe ampelina]|uniref:Putative hsp70 family protein n=1 Tax=Elsinoe ampelina TaxID=302913 RepID=A0A6A6GRB4_9PEZI|nr:putative hsp70 family protein [Elsinoe ampelina]